MLHYKRNAHWAVLLMIAILLVALPLTGCTTTVEDDSTQSTEAEAAEAVFPITVTDDAGREVTIDAEPMRIVSLAPANTEIVAELGMLDRLVGVTTYCDYPPEVADIEKIGDFITPNLEAIAAADPDLVLATTGVQAEVITQLEELGASVVAIDPQTLDALFVSIETVGAVTGTPAEADDLVASMQADLDGIAEKVADVAPVTCFIEIAQDPLFTAGPGTLLNDLVLAAGGDNVVAEEGYVGYSVEQLVTDDPEVYLATLGSMSDPSALDSRAGYESLSAVKDGRVYVLDDNLVSRPGPRVAEGVLSIAEALHPDTEF